MPAPDRSPGPARPAGATGDPPDVRVVSSAAPPPCAPSILPARGPQVDARVGDGLYAPRSGMIASAHRLLDRVGHPCPTAVALAAAGALLFCGSGCSVRKFAV